MAENYIKEKEIANQPKGIPTEEMVLLLDRLKTHICKIYCKDGSHGTGFFCKITKDWNDLRVLMTNNHVLNINDIQPEQTIKFTLDNDYKEYNILIGNERRTYTNETYDVTFIEIKKEDKLDEKSFFEIDKQIFEKNANKIFRNSQIYLLHYPKGNKNEASPGIIKTISEDEENQTIQHTCYTSGGSSGGPIVYKTNFQIIGIHKGAAEGGKNYNLGTFLKTPILKFFEEINKNNNVGNNNDNNIKDNNKDNEKDIKNEKNKENKSSENVNEIENLEEKKDNETRENINDNENIEEDKLNKNNKNDDEIILIKYKIDSIENSKEIKIFGYNFIINNKYKCKLIINGNETELSANLKVNVVQLKNNILEIKLKGIKSINNMNSMFSGCESLSSLPDFSKLNTQNVTDMNGMFNNCKSLISLPDISNWNTQNVTDMKDMLRNCESLSSLPDISNWNTKNVTNMSHMFYNCESLSNLTDISKWNTENVTNMSHMFYNCVSLSSLPDISNWNTQNVTNMSYMFCYCSALSTLPDISKWNTQNVINMSEMFYNCVSLSSLPDISKWNTQSITDMSYMFSFCLSLSSLPDLSKWNIHNVSTMSSMFYNCKSLLSLPDISKWNAKNLKKTDNIFSGCR